MLADALAGLASPQKEELLKMIAEMMHLGGIFDEHGSPEAEKLIRALFMSILAKYPWLWPVLAGVGWSCYVCCRDFIFDCQMIADTGACVTEGNQSADWSRASGVNGQCSVGNLPSAGGGGHGGSSPSPIPLPKPWDTGGDGGHSLM